MFIPQRKVRKIVNSACQDVLFGVEALLDEIDYKNYWPKASWSHALSDVKKIDRNFSASGAVKLSEFIEPFLVWLEERKDRRLSPWGNSRFPTLNESPSRWFLELFYYILGDLTEPGHPQKQVTGAHITQRLREFGTLIAKRKLVSGRWLLFFFSKPPNENLYGFASWLLVYPKTKEIHILCDKEIVFEPNLPTNKVAERLEKIFLHELGHARSDLRFYLSELAKPQTTQFIRATPVHETHAWLYAHVARAFISSVRSRISRLLGDYDNEWK